MKLTLVKLKRISKFISLFNWMAVLLLSNSLSAEMSLVRKGKLTPFFKTDLKFPTKPIEVNSFYLDKYPVTNREFLEFTLKNSKWKKGSPTSLYADNGYLSQLGDVNSESYIKNQENAPVTFISWFAAKAYCDFKGKRLPTTSEWEFAAQIPPAGGNSESIKKAIMKWYSEKKPDDIPLIGKYKNRLGIYDQHGLIWEWVYDFNSASVTGDSRADSDIERDLFCGAGAIKANDFNDYAAYMRYGYRSSLKGWYTAKYLGFRCASDNLVKD